MHVKKELHLIFLIYAVVLTKSLYTSGLGFGLLDEGEYLHNGLRIIRGDIPYRDFFSYLPPLYNYWNVFAFKLFGVSAFSPRLLNSFIFSFVPVLYYLIVRRFSSRIIATLIAISIGFMELSMERLYYHSFTFGSLFCYFAYLRNNRKEIGLLSGLLLGIATLFRIDVALQLLLGLTIVSVFYQFHNSSEWVYASLKQLITIGAGFLVPVAGSLYWLTSHNALSQFVRSSVVTPSAFFKSQTLPFPKPWNIFPASLSPKDIFSSYEAFFMHLIVLIYLLAMYLIIKNWKHVWKNTPELPTFLIVAVFTTPYIFSRPDLGHMVKGGLPAFFVAAYILEKIKKPALKYALLGIPLILILVGVAQLIWWTRFFDTELRTPNGVIRTNSSTAKNSTLVSADTIKKSLAFIDKNSSPEDQVLIIPYMAGLYFLSNRPSKSYVGNIYYSYIPDEGKFVEELRRLNLKVVIYDLSNAPPGFSQKLHEFYPKIDEYIMDNFEIVEESPEGWMFLVRR